MKRELLFGLAFRSIAPTATEIQMDMRLYVIWFGRHVDSSCMQSPSFANNMLNVKFECISYLRQGAVGGRHM